MTLPLNKKYRPMEAKPASKLPAGPEWQYEPKWDGFCCLAFRDGKRVDLQSKAGKPLTRYFPELATALAALPAYAIRFRRRDRHPARRRPVI
jgi:ATP-dependent DNA ligase